PPRRRVRATTRSTSPRRSPTACVARLARSAPGIFCRLKPERDASLRLWHHSEFRPDRLAMLAPDTSATRQLAEFAAALSYNDLPQPVFGPLNQSILDALRSSLFA